MAYYEKTVKKKTYKEVPYKGLAYPQIFKDKSTNAVSGVDKIKQSLECLIRTPKGSRFFNPEYGTDVENSLFELNDFILRDELDYQIREAIRRFEPRVTLLDLQVESLPDTLMVRINIVYLVNDNGLKEELVIELEREVVNPYEI